MALGLPGNQWGLPVRDFSVHTLMFVVSVTTVKVRGLSYQTEDFSYQDSWYQLPKGPLVT